MEKTLATLFSTKMTRQRSPSMMPIILLLASLSLVAFAQNETSKEGSAATATLGYLTTEQWEESLKTSLEQLSELEVEMTLNFDEQFKQKTLGLEKRLDNFRLECQDRYKTDKSAREKCFRKIIQLQRKYTEVHFEKRQDYLKLIHEQQLKDLKSAKEYSLKQLDRQF
jgi:hypothetical protein